MTVIIGQNDLFKSHTHSLNGVVVSKSNDWGIKAIGSTGGIETRTKNITIKIWKRTI